MLVRWLDECWMFPVGLSALNGVCVSLIAANSCLRFLCSLHVHLFLVDFNFQQFPCRKRHLLSNPISSISLWFSSICSLRPQLQLLFGLAQETSTILSRLLRSHRSVSSVLLSPREPHVASVSHDDFTSCCVDALSSVGNDWYHVPSKIT